MAETLLHLIINCSLLQVCTVALLQVCTVALLQGGTLSINQTWFNFDTLLGAMAACRPCSEERFGKTCVISVGVALEWFRCLGEGF